jgi:hypothetical protein
MLRHNSSSNRVPMDNFAVRREEVMIASTEAVVIHLTGGRFTVQVRPA